MHLSDPEKYDEARWVPHLSLLHSRGLHNSNQLINNLFVVPGFSDYTLLHIVDFVPKQGNLTAQNLYNSAIDMSSVR
jgi:hypothetical protein